MGTQFKLINQNKGAGCEEQEGAWFFWDTCARHVSHAHKLFPESSVGMFQWRHSFAKVQTTTILLLIDSPVEHIWHIQLSPVNPSYARRCKFFNYIRSNGRWFNISFYSEIVPFAFTLTDFSQRIFFTLFFFKFSSFF